MLITANAKRPSLIDLYNARQGLRIDSGVWLFAGNYYNVDLGRKVAPIRIAKDQNAMKAKHADRSGSRLMFTFRPHDFNRIRKAHNLA